MFKIDLNCDLGESYGPYKIGNDQEMMKYISSANIACGFHGGDPSIMRETVLLALENDVSIGAHPGLPDLNGFGRREMNLSLTEAYSMVVYQIGALQAFVQSEGGKLTHVKPHGALYNMCASNALLAEKVCEAIYRVNPELVLFGLSNSELITAGEKIGLKTASEVFADRTYQRDGSLTPRSKSNALIENVHEALTQVLKMVKEQKVTTIDGMDVPIKAETICLHGDGLHALDFAKHISATLLKEGIEISPLSI
ncbi:5-oxoprolinase subunit PxpA [Bacillus sp. 31A1R]|uniref:5-oxoprolinase subunit A n=1 Tax=Robertmurraya mangrovi TaxID=3098077 RepID=A0ABU5IWW3_9BACI|nr:5-oxoprolinase subunit PxpA [Bacillus sp. 31A1R]MDZ5471627.1 5-oxoprolinase subunit PxpA [Bacillus sp. 31A1R]